MSHDNVLSRMSNKKSCITLHIALKASSDSAAGGDTPTIGCGYVTDCDFQQLSNLSLHSSATFLAFLTCFSLSHLLNRICLGSLTAAQTSLFCPTSRRNQEKELSQTCNFRWQWAAASTTEISFAWLSAKSQLLSTITFVLSFAIIEIAAKLYLQRGLLIFWLPSM